MDTTRPPSLVVGALALVLLALAGCGGAGPRPAASGPPHGHFDVTAYGAVGDGRADDTRAIQAAIDAAERDGGGTVDFPAGVYRVAGPLRDAGRGSAQILLPSRDVMHDAQVTVVLRGALPPPQIPSVVGRIVTPAGGSVLAGALDAGHGALLGGWGPPGSYQDFSMVQVVVEDLTFRLPPNPALTAVDLAHVAAAELREVTVDTGAYTLTDVAEPTHADSYGVRLPANNNGAWTLVRGVNVIGYYTGWQLGEHTDADAIGAWACRYAADLPAANHASRVGRMLVADSAYGLHFSGTHPIAVDEYDVEHYNPATFGHRWYDPLADIDDPHDLGVGRVAWWAVEGGVGPDDRFVVAGGARLTVARLGGH